MRSLTPPELKLPLHARWIAVGDDWVIEDMRNGQRFFTLEAMNDVGGKRYTPTDDPEERRFNVVGAPKNKATDKLAPRDQTAGA